MIKKWIICSDSQVALTSIQSMNYKSNNGGYIYKILIEMTAAMKAGHDIALQWVPGHCGLTGNEAADCLAKKAHWDGQYQRVPLSRGDTREILRTMVHTV